MNRILTAAAIALALGAPVVAHANPISCMPNAPYGHTPQWAVEVVKQRGDTTATSPTDPNWQHATCDEAKHIVLSHLPGADEAPTADCAIFNPDTHQCIMTNEQLKALGPTHPIDEHKRLVTAWHVLNAQCEKTGEVDDGPYSNTCRAANGIAQILEAQGYFLNKDSKWQKSARPETPAERKLREFNSANE